VLIFALDLGNLLLLATLRFTARSESPSERGSRLVYYVVLTWVLAPYVYSHLDLGVTFFVAMAILIMMTRLGWGWGFLFLALGIHFKLTPMVLAPLFVIGSIPADGRVLSRVYLIAGRSLVLVAMVVAMFLPAWFWYGPRSLDFLVYHSGRGLQIESLYANIVLLLRAAGMPATVGYDHSSFSVSSPLGTSLAGLAPLFAGLAIVLVTLGYTGKLLAAGPAGTCAQSQPGLFAGTALLLLLVFIATNKVFSPQYLIWLPVLVAVCPLTGTPRTLMFTGFFLLALLTRMIYPNHYHSDIIRKATLLDGSVLYQGPNTFGLGLLTIRNVLFACITIALGFILVRPYCTPGLPPNNPS